MAIITVKIGGRNFKMIKKLFTLFFLLTLSAFGQSAPSDSTEHYHIRQWATGANPGATALNRNYDIIDSILYHGNIKQIGAAIFDPQEVYNKDTGIVCIDIRTSDSLTFTRVDVSCDIDPTTELDFNLYYADSLKTRTNAVLINELNTTNGICAVTSFTHAGVPSGKCIYLLFDAQPEAAINQLAIKFTYVFN